MVKPETGQANFSENKIRSGPLLSWIFATFFAAGSVCSLPPPCGGGAGRGGAADTSPRRLGLPPLPTGLRPGDLPRKGGGGVRCRWRIGVLDDSQPLGEF